MFKVGKTLSGSQASIFRRVQLFWGYVVRVKKRYCSTRIGKKAVQELGMAFCLLSGRLAACWR